MSIEKNVLTANVTEYKIAAGTRYELWAIAVWCGAQLSVTIGNQCAHIGAVAMGCPRPPSPAGARCRLRGGGALLLCIQNGVRGRTERI